MNISADWLHSEGPQALIAALEAEGFEAYFVGGCVRNTLLGEPVSDIDLATSSHPETVSNIATNAGFKVIPTGIDHGTVTVVAAGETIEVTTFRKDVETDGRRAVVAFAEALSDDAMRRDFTVNALYSDARGVVTDPVGGLADIETRTIRFIGSAKERVREDALRILRFFRFHAWYGDPDGGIDADALAACAELADLLDGLSRERVGQEMRKLLSAPDPAPAVASFDATGGLARVIPGATAQMLAPLVHVEAEAKLSPDWIRRLVVMGPPDDVVSRLRLSKAEARSVESLRAAFAADMTPTELGFRYGSCVAHSAIAAKAATFGVQLVHDHLANAEHGAAQVFPVKAGDLPDGLHGPAVGAALRQIEQRWIDSGFRLTKQELLS